MNKKLTIVDIADLVSSKSGMTKKESELFAKEFFALATEVISKGESLTINGVGSFVPVWVETRSSVDVNTKQPIEIPGHYKLSFTPDKTMRDAVNAPFAAFTTEVVEVGNEESVSDNTTPLDDNSVVVDVVEEESVTDDTTLLDDGNILEEVVDEEVVMDESEFVEEQEVEESLDKEVEDKEKQIEVTEEDKQIVTPLIEENNIDAESLKKEFNRRTRNGYIGGFLTALIMFVIFILVWIFFVNDGQGVSFSFSSFKISSVNEVEEQQPLVIEENKVDPLVVEPVEEKVDSIKSVTINEENVVKEPIIETIERGKYLTTIAQKYFGDKVFWVYIYRENSGRIWNPKDLKAGFEVVVPDASKYNIDASNPESIQRAKELEKQILYEIE
jgi:nucleoid DNA-binding protein